jgi:hypothetical protein
MSRRAEARIEATLEGGAAERGGRLAPGSPVVSRGGAERSPLNGAPRRREAAVQQ